MAKLAPPATVVNFGERVEVLRRQEALVAIAQVQLALAALRKDIQLIALVQEMSVATLTGPMLQGPEHAAALAKLATTLEEISKLVPSPKGV